RTAERYEEINAALGEEARRDPNLRGFATTLTAAANLGKDLLVAHAGDSRVYLCRRGQLSRLTRDHTLAQARADAGLLPQERVATHRLRHILLKVIGGQDREVEPDVQMYALEDGDG